MTLTITQLLLAANIITCFLLLCLSPKTTPSEPPSPATATINADRRTGDDATTNSCTNHNKDFDDGNDDKTCKRRKRIPLPREWDDYGFFDIFEDLDCYTIIYVKYPRPIVDLETWILLRKAYVFVVGKEKSTIAPLSSTENGFSINNIAFEVKQTDDHKGRGVFSKQFIPKGTLVWSARQSARFDNGLSYKEYLSILPNDMACDVIQWSYVMAMDDEGEKSRNKILTVDLDEGALLNSASVYDRDMTNIGCDPSLLAAAPTHVKGGCSDNNFALRDIQPGEEMLVYYRDFSIYGAWHEFGL